MSSTGLWFEPMYREMVLVVLLFLFLISGVIFYLKTKSPKFLGAWASLKSWIFTAPILFLFIGLPKPWPLVALLFAAIYGSKAFYKMVGMYHRSWFIWVTYLFIVALGFVIFRGYDRLYDIMPMIFSGCIASIPLLRNSAKYMIQYIALSLIAFAFFGWCLMFMGRILMFENGIYIALYIYILVEFSENVSMAGTRFFGKHKPFSNITSRISVEGMALAFILTLLLAWGLRHLLPDRSEPFWLAAGLIATIFGRFGDLLVSVIRRDLGIKDTGVFIIGRDDIIARLDKLIFVAPIFYYTLTLLQQYKSNL